MNVDRLAGIIVPIGVAAILVAVALGMLCSCRTPQPIVQTEVKKIVERYMNIFNYTELFNVL